MDTTSATPGHFNPRSPRGERRLPQQRTPPERQISIHAPLAGSDVALRLQEAVAAYFNPRSPRGERRRSGGLPRSVFYFNPRSPRGERHLLDFLPLLIRAISIHAPLAGSDHGHAAGRCRVQISIHAPLAGSDSQPGCRQRPGTYFNPRSPRGERLAADDAISVMVIFQSTLPSRGATAHCHLQHPRHRFQSTLPSRGATSEQAEGFLADINFNPRSPRGERLFVPSQEDFTNLFQSTLPSRGATSHTPWRWPWPM